jgi:hypothetical protein
VPINLIIQSRTRYYSPWNSRHVTILTTELNYYRIEELASKCCEAYVINKREGVEIKFPNTHSNKGKVKHRVPLDSAISLLLFLMYINDPSSNINPFNAEHKVCLRSIKDITLYYSKFQKHHMCMYTYTKCMCVCVCVYIYIERERERESVCVCVCGRGRGRCLMTYVKHIVLYHCHVLTSTIFCSNSFHDL